jgi:hypothetical protein
MGCREGAQGGGETAAREGRRETTRVGHRRTQVVPGFVSNYLLVLGAPLLESSTFKPLNTN